MNKQDNNPVGKRTWWQKPGLGIIYQVEARPGWLWERNFDEFNASMKDEKGKLRYNGPFWRVKDWVEFSKGAGVDYHICESKWHDGICFFDTKYTEWKTPVDYCKLFAEESKKAGIPFMFYYSNIFDHNPQFDDIQPLRGFTASFIARHGKNKEEVRNYSLEYNRRAYPGKRKSLIDIHLDWPTYNPQKYETYLLNQMTEQIENYQPDGMWMDWYMGKVENSAHLVMDFMKAKYPDVVLTFNVSNRSRLKWAHYTSGEAHTVRSAWDQGNEFRRNGKPWELVGPATLRWDDLSSRSDPHEVARIAAITMASGGKYAFSLPSQMDGTLYPEPAKQLAAVADWYKPRRSLFTEAVPMKYIGERVPGVEIVEISEIDFGTVGSIQGNDRLIHIFNFSGAKKWLALRFIGSHWRNIQQILLEPAGKEIKILKRAGMGNPYWPEETDVLIREEDVDPVDTILRVKV